MQLWAKNLKNLNSLKLAFFGIDGFQLNTCLSRNISSASLITEDLVRDRVLSDGNRQQIIKRLQRIKTLKSTSSHGKDASILMPLCIVDGQLSFLYTLRSPRLSTHAGQVSFPGGVMDKSDSSLISTALRETEEELGIHSSEVDIWTSLIAVPDRRRKFRVTPVLGYLGNIKLENLNVNEDEVHDVFAVPLTTLLKPEHQGYTLFRNGWKMPVICNVKHIIWGLTAIATDVFLANAFPDLYQLKVHRLNGDITRVNFKN